MTRGNTWAVIALIGLVVAGLIFGPPILSSLGKSWRSFWSLFTDQNSALGASLISLTVTFVDGTSKTISSTTTKLIELSPFGPLDPSGLEIRDVKGFIVAYVYSNIQPQSGSLSGTVRILSENGNELKHLQSTSNSPLVTQRTQGDWQSRFELSPLTVTGDEIKNAYSGSGGQHYIAFVGDVSATLTFEDNQATKSASTPSTRFYFNMPTIVSGAITGLDAIVDLNVAGFREL